MFSFRNFYCKALTLQTLSIMSFECQIALLIVEDAGIVSVTLGFKVILNYVFAFLSFISALPSYSLL